MNNKKETLIKNTLTIIASSFVIALLILPNTTHTTTTCMKGSVVTTDCSNKTNSGYRSPSKGLNAIGDLRKFDIEAVEAMKRPQPNPADNWKNLGPIVTTHTLTFSFPQLGSKKGFTFKPTAGELRNREIQVIAESHAGRNAQESAGVTFYRQLPGEQLWTEAGTFFITQAEVPVNMIEATVELKADGTVEFPTNANTLQQVLIGNRILLNKTKNIK